MKYIFFLLAALFVMNLACFGQKPSPTPAPERIEDNSVRETIRDIRSESPIKLSKPLLKDSQDDRQVIVYLVADTANAENDRYQVKVYYREKRMKNYPVENEAESATLIVDGKLFSPLSFETTVSENKNQLFEPFSINTSTWTFEIPEAELESFKQAKTISVMRKQTIFSIPVDGFEILRNFLSY